MNLIRDIFLEIMLMKFPIHLPGVNMLTWQMRMCLTNSVYIRQMSTDVGLVLYAKIYERNSFSLRAQRFPMYISYLIGCVSDMIRQYWCLHSSLIGFRPPGYVCQNFGIGSQKALCSLCDALKALQALLICCLWHPPNELYIWIYSWIYLHEIQ